MILSYFNKINNFFKNSDINFFNPLSIIELQTFLNSFFLDPNAPFHSHNDICCKSKNLKYLFSYTRQYTIFKNNEIIDAVLSIPVFYCPDCNHYHAFLPHHFILPYSQYSIPFILCVLYDKKYSGMTVNEIVDKYHIAVSTLYRWNDRYARYLTYYQNLRNKYQCELLKALINHYIELLDDMFDISTHSLFQFEHKLTCMPTAP